MVPPDMKPISSWCKAQGKHTHTVSGVKQMKPVIKGVSRWMDIFGEGCSLSLFNKEFRQIKV